MSREIKFRAWSEKDNTYVKMGSIAVNTGIDTEFTLKDGAKYTVEQYTGVKDKNGKEIYEGDIVKCYSTADEPCLAVVRYGRMPDICGHEYCPCKIGFYLDDKVHFDEDFGEDDDHGDLEVIGNIHENPKLLGGEE